MIIISIFYIDGHVRAFDVNIDLYQNQQEADTESDVQVDDEIPAKKKGSPSNPTVLISSS